MIQYPKNTHMTLPSVEAGFGTLNILRDPPKSIHTRYKPKVGETSDLTQMIEDSGDRSCEVIKPYARGVNPFVSVSYSNYGTNGGQMRYRDGATGTGQDPISIRGSGNVQSSYPYKIMEGGAFRPPITPPQDLLPLSRMPRLVTKQQTNPGSTFTKVENMLKCNSKDLREVRQELLKVCSRPTKIFNFEKPQTAPYDVKNNINQDKKTVRAETSRMNKQHSLNVNAKPERGINQTVSHAFASSNKSSNIQGTPIDQQAGNQPIRLNNKVKTSCTSNISKRGEGQGYMKYARKHERTLPVASASTNTCQTGVDMNSTITDRQYRNLRDRPSRGGFMNGGMKSRFGMEVPNVKLSTEKSIFQKAEENRNNRMR